MYTDEQVKDRDQAKQLNIYLLAGLLQIFKSKAPKYVKSIVTDTIEKGKTVYPEAFPDTTDKKFE
jgi:hypothetical protein